VFQCIGRFARSLHVKRFFFNRSLLKVYRSFSKWFLKKLKCDGLIKMLTGFEDKSGSAVCCFAFCKGKGHEPLLFNGIVKVRPHAMENSMTNLT
jgi:hypothetical protein